VTVHIQQLEQLPDTAGNASPTTRSGGIGTTGANGPSFAQEAQVLAVIRREESRRARLWAD